MKKVIQLLIATTLACSPLISQAETVSLTSMNWPPFYAQELNKGGFVTVLVEESLKASGYDSTMSFTSWQDALDTVKSGKKDAIVGGYYSDERAKDYYYSIPIYTVYTGLIHKTGFALNQFASFDSLDKYNIGKLKGSVVGESFDAFPFSHLKEFPEVTDAMKALQSGDIDLYADSLSVAKEAAKKVGIDPASLSILQPPIDQNDLYLLISKSIPNGDDIRKAFNKGLMTIKANGTYDKILAEFNQK